MTSLVASVWLRNECHSGIRFCVLTWERSAVEAEVSRMAPTDATRVTVKAGGLEFQSGRRRASGLVQDNQIKDSVKVVHRRMTANDYWLSVSSCDWSLDW
jgi:hypothetical protein